MKIVIGTEKDINSDRFGYGIEILSRQTQVYRQDTIESKDLVEVQLSAAYDAMLHIPSVKNDTTLAFFVEPESVKLLQDEKSDNPIYSSYLDKIFDIAKMNNYKLVAFDISQHRGCDIYSRYKTAKAIASHYLSISTNRPIYSTRSIPTKGGFNSGR